MNSRRWPPKPEGKEATVVLIMELMARGEYQRGDLASLAEAWGARYWTCGDWTAEAGRRLRALRTDEDILAILEERLVDIIQDNNPKDRVAAVRLLLEERQLLGASKKASEDLSGMSDEHLLALIERQVKSLPGKVETNDRSGQDETQ